MRRTSLPLWIACTLWIGCGDPTPDPPPTAPPALAHALDPDAQPPEQPAQAPQAPISIVDALPNGEAQPDATIKIRFNRAIAPLASLDEQDADGLLTLSPPVPGVAAWLTPDTLTFTPTDHLPYATAFEVKITNKLENLAQTPLSPKAWTFQTPPPALEATLPEHRERDIAPDAPLYLAFTQPIALDALRQHLRAEARPYDDEDPSAPGKPLALTIARWPPGPAQETPWIFHNADEEERFVVHARGGWTPGRTIALTIDAALTGTQGPRPFGAPTQLRFQTWGPLRLEALNCDAERPCTAGRVDLTVTMSNELRPKQEALIQISPAPKNLVKTIDYTNIRIDAIFQPELDYTITISPGLRDTWGQALAAPLRRVVRFQRPEATLALSDEGGLLQAQKPVTIGVETRHMDSAQLRISPLDEAALRALVAQGHNPLDTAQRPAPAGDAPITRTLRFAGTGDSRWSAQALDLAREANAPFGAALVSLEPLETVDPDQYATPADVEGFYQWTDLGVSAAVSTRASLVRVVSLSTGRAVAGAQVELWLPGQAAAPLGESDASGHLDLPALPRWAADPGRALLFLRAPGGADHVLVELDRLYGGWNWRWGGGLDQLLTAPRQLHGQLLTERGVYKPGEWIGVVAWTGVDDLEALSSVALPPQGLTARLTLTNPAGEIVHERALPISPQGKIDARLPLPDKAPLGRWRIALSLPAHAAEGELSVTARVEDYRAPSFEVQAAAQQPEVLDGEPATARFVARYYFGAPVQIEHLRPQHRCHATSPPLPALAEGWRAGVHLDHSEGASGGMAIRPLTDDERRRGAFSLSAATDSPPERQTLRCTITGVIQDPSFQEVGAEASFLVHPAARYLALHAPARPLSEGDDAQLRLLGVDWQGRPADLAAQTKITVTRRWWEPQIARKGNRRYVRDWIEKTQALSPCLIAPRAEAQEGACALRKLPHGDYLVEATATLQGHQARSQAGFYVSRRHWSLDVDPPERLTLTVPREPVPVGGALPVTIQGPDGLQGTLLVQRGGLRGAWPFTLHSGQAALSIPIDDGAAPRLTLHALAWKPGPAAGRPEVQEDTAEVSVTYAHRKLQVALQAPDAAAPGQTLPVRVQVLDDKGRPVQGRVALWATDEAVLALTRYELPDLLDAFIVDRDADTLHLHSDHLILYPYTPPEEDPALYGLGASGTGYGAGGAACGGVGVMGGGRATARARFETTPLFLGDLALDAQGRAEATLPLPKNLTTFRLIAVASDALPGTREPGRFGTAQRWLRVEAPLVVQAAAPRHLRPGDEAGFAAVVTHRGKAPGTLEVTVTRTGGDGVGELLGDQTRRLPVAPGQTLRVPFSLRATAQGELALELRARFQADGAAAPEAEDALALTLPVAVEATLIERVAVYGELDGEQPVQLPLKVPREALPGWGGLSLQVSGTILGGLESAARALIEYPYGCAEQTSSRMIPLVALTELTQALQLQGDQHGALMQDGIARLLTMQTAEGGFAYWPGGDRPDAWVSAYVTWVLWMAQRQGHAVPAEPLTRALDWLRVQTRAPDRDWPEAALYLHDTRRALALFVLAQAGRPEPDALAELYTGRARLPLFAQGFLLLALQATQPDDPRVRGLADELIGRLQETPGGASTTEQPRWSLDELFHSDARSDAIVLWALIDARPEHPVIPKLARGLMSRRRGAAWRNTQENAWAALALARYARRYEPQPPDLRFEATAGPAPLLEADLRGRGAPPREGRLTMAALLGQVAEAPDALLPVLLHRHGQGRAYYRLELSYAPRGDLPARARGLELTRALRSASGPLAPDAQVRAGDILALDLTVSTRGAVRYVALDAPLPAGLEVISLDLGGPQALPLPGRRGAFVSHEELRRDRALLFADELQPGTHTHTVYLRATTPGRYSFPPSRAEAMYAPEVFGRTPSATLTVLDRAP